MGQVFVSIDRADRVHLQGICDAIEESGHTFWHDGLVEAHEPFAERVEAEIERSIGVIALLTGSSLKSDWVRYEVEYAASLRREVVPLTRSLELRELSAPPWAVELRKRRHIVRFQDNVGEATRARIVESLRWIEPNAAKVVSFVNFKGGVGKTTLCALCGYFLALDQRRDALLLDLDAQENLGDLFLSREAMEESAQTSRTVLSLFEPVRMIETIPPDKDFQHVTRVEQPIPAEAFAELPTRVAGAMEPGLGEGRLSLVPSDYRLMKFSSGSPGLQEVFRDHFKRSLGQLKRVYDLILIDCGPSASLLSHCALNYADMVVAPVQPNESARRGLTSMRRAARDVFDCDIDEKIHPLFNFLRQGVVGEYRYVEKFTEDPAGNVSADLAFLGNNTLRSRVPQSGGLVNLNTVMDRRLLQRQDGGRRLARRLGRAGPALVSLAQEVVERLGLPVHQAPRKLGH